MIIKECEYTSDIFCEKLDILPISCGKIYDENSDKIINYICIMSNNYDGKSYLFTTEKYNGIEYYKSLTCRDVRAGARGILRKCLNFFPILVSFERLLEIVDNLIYENNSSWKEDYRINQYRIRSSRQVAS